MATDQAKNMFRVEPELLPSMAEAKNRASFVVRMPTMPQDGFASSWIRYYWPPQIPRTKENPRADYLHARYLGDSAAYIDIAQGFFGRYHALAMMAPDDAKGEVVVQGNKCIWVAAIPESVPVQSDTQNPPKAWRRDFLALEWQTGEDEDSRMYFGIASNVLNLEALVGLAETVKPI